MPEPQFAVYVPVSAVFPDIEADFKTLHSLLQSLSRTDTLIWCARLNLALSDPTTAPIERQKNCMVTFLSPGEIKHAFAFAQEVESADKRVIFFFRGQLLELMRWVALYSEDLPGDGETLNDPAVRRRFAQAALICSEISDTAVWGTDSVDDTASSLFEGNAPGLLRKSAEATATTDLVVCLGRGWTLFRDYLPKHYPSFDKEFRRATGLSIEQCFACLAMVLVDSRRPPESAGFRHGRVLRRTAYNEIFGQYIHLQSQTPGDLRRKWRSGFPKELLSLSDAPPCSKRPLLDRPILRTHHGRAIVLDPLSFGESAVAGPLFHVMKAKQRGDRGLFPAFGSAFEDYVNDILGRMFPTSIMLANRLLTNETIAEYGGSALQVDACINDVTNVVLFETKALWMSEEKLLTDDHQVYLAHLRSKYVDPKGANQLARMISALSDPRQSRANVRFNGAQLVYPVMIVRDRFVPTPFLGRFLQPEFHRCLKPDEILPSKRMKKGNLTVTPPIVLDIETLEGLESSITHHGFLDLLDDYSRECSDGTTSLGNFIACSPKYEQHFNPRQSVAAKFVEALEATAREVFPEADLSQL
jgi:hypothetical protein